jgi:hypothetical protein
VLVNGGTVINPPTRSSSIAKYEAPILSSNALLALQYEQYDLENMTNTNKPLELIDGRVNQKTCHGYVYLTNAIIIDNILRLGVCGSHHDRGWSGGKRAEEPGE